MNGVVQCEAGHSVTFHDAAEVDRPEVDLIPLGRVVDAGREDFGVAYAGQDLQVSCVNRAVVVDGVQLVTDVDPVAVTDAVARAVGDHVVPLAMDVVVLLAMGVVARRVGVEHLVIDAEDVEVRLVDVVDQHEDFRDHRVKRFDGVADRLACVVGHQVPREGQLEDDYQLGMDAVHFVMNVAHLDADRLAAVTYADHHLERDAMGRLVQSVVQFVMDAVRSVGVLVVTGVVVVRAEAVAHAMDRAVRVVCEFVAGKDCAAIVRMFGSTMADPLGWVPVVVALGCSEATATPFYFSV